MIPVRYTRNLFLRAMCVVYLCSFISFYIQIPGLYGDNGILPARALLENTKHKSFSAKVHYQPTLLWLAPYLGLDTNYALDVLAILGSFLAFTGFVSQKFCTIPLFTGLWSLYFSLYQVGQIFVKSQWDEFLLESGFLALLVAPLLPGKRRGSKGSPRDAICLWLVKWLLFRYLLSTGLVKLLSGCPQWWDLKALIYYFQSMVLPTPLSWYAHHLPTWILRLASVFTNIAEIVLPFSFFVPIRNIRIVSFVVQLSLQTTIFLTGNFNFLNLLSVTLSVSILDDQFFYGKRKSREGEGRNVAIWSTLATLLFYGAILYGIVVFFNLKINGSQIDVNVGYSRDQFNAVVKQILLYSVYFGLASLGFTAAKAASTSLIEPYGFVPKLLALLQTMFYAGTAMTIFFGSTVPLSSMHVATNSTVSPTARTIQNRLEKLHIVNNYGLFTKMTGLKGRPEIVIEGSNNIDGPWQEYNFLYKPGNVNNSLPFVAPHSPRLDWQMWWAAQGSYQSEPWLLSFVHRLLQGRPEVLSLLDRHHSPFGDKPPKYIRGVLYNYKYTQWNQRWQPSWWKREKVSEYFPIFTLDSPALLDTLKARNLLPMLTKQYVNPMWKQILDTIRYVTNLEASQLMWAVIVAACAIITTKARNK